MLTLKPPTCALLLILLGLPACQRGAPPSSASAPALEYEKYELPNGLDVILHVDRSDPLTAVALTFHVGSAREVAGRTGFAHLFEHLFFLDSEDLGPGGLDRLMTRVGSATNGSTNRDRTNYYEVVPKDALEKVLWAEADKLGFFINTVTEAVVDKERQVVKNEKRQRVDNQPYGHVNEVIDRALYPEGHPYRWQVIGSLEDLDAASLADVKQFHGRWYGPGNATLVVAGDIDVKQTKAWIEKYFAEIPARPLPPAAKPPAVKLAASTRLLHEDNFARLPRLTVAWPTVPLYHPDSYALDLLGRLLADGERTPLYQVIVKEAKLAPSVQAENRSQELTGRFTIQVTAQTGTDLDSVMAAMQRGFARFEKGVAAGELERVKAGAEAEFYTALGSTLDKAFLLANYNIFAPTPGFLPEDLKRLLAVTAGDVSRVYQTYLKDRPYIAASSVPRGSAELSLASSDRAQITEEPIVPGEGQFVPAARGEVPRTTSALDRSVEPPFGSSPSLRAPDVHRDSLGDGLRVLLIQNREMPLVQFELRFKGGTLLEDPARVGVANLLAETITKGTAKRTPEELELAIQILGGTIEATSGRETFTISGRTLARNYAQTMELLQELLLEPRWDSLEFVLARERVQNALRRRSAEPVALAEDAFARLLYGDHILGRNPLGELGSVDSITIADLRAYYERAIVPNLGSFLVAGAVAPEDVRASLRGLEGRWRAREVRFPKAPAWLTDRGGLYFLDVPDAKQSVLAIGYLALRQTDPDYYPATVMNFRLGGGGFASDLLQTLREQKGYTYGIFSGFEGTDLPGPFQITSSVRSNVTLESLQLVKGLVERYGPSFDDEDLGATKSFLLKSNALAFETLEAKLGILEDMSAYGFPADYVLQREAIVKEMTVDRVGELAKRYLDPKKMVWLVVGDARTQQGRLRSLGLGTPVPVDREGRRVAAVSRR